MVVNHEDTLCSELSKQKKLYNKFLLSDESILFLYLEDNEKCFKKIIDNIFDTESSSFEVSDPVELIKCLLEYSSRKEILEAHCPPVLYAEFEDFLWTYEDI